MNFLKGLKILAVAGVLVVVGLFSSCEQDLTTIGDGVIGGEPFTTDKVTYDVFAFNKKIEAVQTNQLPIYQLGVYTDPIYGKTEASITSQLQLSAYGPTFGDLTQQNELANNTLENETIDSVFIYIPYLNSQIDTDNDGVVDALDSAPNDPANDSDGDTVPNNIEVANNTDPLNQDTDGDGDNDNVDDSTLGGRFAERFELDSIYYNNQKSENESEPNFLGQSFNLKVERSTFFLRDADPGSNFQDAQQYYSNERYSPDFTEEVFFDGNTIISDREILFVVEEDDPDTEADESGTISSKLDPGIRVKLNDVANNFFQANILDKEGGSELLSSSNFKEFFRGIHISATPITNDLLFFLDLTDAKINVYYSYDNINDDESIEKLQGTLELNLITQTGNNPIIGNAVNTLINETYPADITNAFNNSENASKIYLKGGAGSYAEVKLFDEDIEEAETLINEIKANDWIINEANLVFFIDREAIPAMSIEPPRLYLYNAETNAPLYDPLSERGVTEVNTPLGIFPNHDGVLEESDGQGLRYTVRITDYINDIIVRDSTNATLGLTITPDIRLAGANSVMLADGNEKDLPAASVLSPLGTVLFGSNLPNTDEKKLKLEIFYTETN
ncbi:DUF4270 domain-containing protein [Maribacter sp. 2308TA10-17]|uniref:DUF4270 domain-containing protein n=1 Tax=Maribacter sp. 2308TA10-17 TaxID=3386276 RepID=UPI0039BD4326